MLKRWKRNWFVLLKEGNVNNKEQFLLRKAKFQVIKMSLASNKKKKIYQANLQQQKKITCYKNGVGQYF